LLVEIDGGAESVSTAEARPLPGYGHICRSQREGLGAGCYYQDAGQDRRRRGFMLWTVVVILVILWLLGMLGTVSIPMLSGNTVHVLLVIVIIIVAIQLLQRRRL